MNDLIVSHVSKRYRIQSESEAQAQSAWRRLTGWRLADFYAVRDLSFEVARGEALGIIGHNGAGKSTVLKMLSNITTPTAGEIVINGHLAALIEVGSGFHPELTGRENVYLNGAILGMRRREIAARLDNIIDFAGVRKFIDVPVKRYSSGMYVRLGFSIAAHLSPDILLLDEVLAVGDTSFQAKCLARIQELERAGTTIIFISHDLGAVEQLCDRVLLMQQGSVVAEGRPPEVIARYQQLSGVFAPPPEKESANLTREAEISSFRLCDAEARETAVFKTGDSLHGELKYIVRRPVSDVVFGGFIYSQSGQLVCHLTSELSNERIDLQPGAGAVELYCPELGLQPGLYQLEVVIWERDTPDQVDRRSGYRLRVDPGRLVHGLFLMPHEWRLVETEQSTFNQREAMLDELSSRA
jgi:ABC-type polysaccharide/polyol phosphate transport system ATPase subunit